MSRKKSNKGKRATLQQPQQQQEEQEVIQEDVDEELEGYEEEDDGDEEEREDGEAVDTDDSADEGEEKEVNREVLDILDPAAHVTEAAALDVKEEVRCFCCEKPWKAIGSTRSFLPDCPCALHIGDCKCGRCKLHCSCQREAA